MPAQGSVQLFPRLDFSLYAYPSHKREKIVAGTPTFKLNMSSGHIIHFYKFEENRKETNSKNNRQKKRAGVKFPAHGKIMLRGLRQWLDHNILVVDHTFWIVGL